MKKVLFSLLVLIFLIAGCSLPEYQLDFEITSEEETVVGGGFTEGEDVRIHYRIENVGRSNLTNVQITVKINTGSTYTTSGTDLDTGESKTGSFIMPVYTGETFVAKSAVINSVGWDTE